MSTERQKMLAGEMYAPFDPELAEARVRARDLCQDLNASREADTEGRRVVTRDVPDSVFAAGNPCRVIRPIAD